ncbi:MAG: F0F1 ATP synthase subunit alpha, partial [Lutibacter sp.]|nr:F0F1 ATP synthase subunit alpha [Lutibacter sp.]
MPKNELKKNIQKTFRDLDAKIENHVFSFRPREVGTIKSISPGVVMVSGLPNVGFEELLKFPANLFGIAYNIDEDEIGVILLG